MSSGIGNVTLYAASLGYSGQEACLSPITNASNAKTSLTAEGESDWLFWAGIVPVHKASSAELISYNPFVTGSLLEYTDDPRLLTLGGGRCSGHIPLETGMTFTIQASEMGSRLESSADTAERTLRLHIGGRTAPGLWSLTCRTVLNRIG